MTEIDVTERKRAEELLKKNGLDRFCYLIPKFYDFAAYLLEENKKHNLTALREIGDVWVRHFADSLLFADMFEGEHKTLIDVGCGGGFPSIPLAIACKNLKVTAMDSTKKKTDFVVSAAQRIKIDNYSALCARAEEAGKNKVYRERYDIATARAVAALPALAEYCLPLVRVGGAFLSYKGKDAEIECAAAEPIIANLGGKIEKIEKRILTDENGEEMERALIVIRKVRNTPPVFPRKNSAILKSK